jgi:multidrug resistance efflux pump
VNDDLAQLPTDELTRRLLELTSVTRTRAAAFSEAQTTWSAARVLADAGVATEAELAQAAAALTTAREALQASQNAGVAVGAELARRLAGDAGARD